MKKLLIRALSLTLPVSLLWFVLKVVPLMMQIPGVVSERDYDLYHGAWGLVYDLRLLDFFENEVRASFEFVYTNSSEIMKFGLTLLCSGVIFTLGHVLIGRRINAENYKRIKLDQARAVSVKLRNEQVKFFYMNWAWHGYLNLLQAEEARESQELEKKFRHLQLDVPSYVREARNPDERINVIRSQIGVSEEDARRLLQSALQRICFKEEPELFMIAAE